MKPSRYISNKDIDSKLFAKSVAKVILELASSHAYFMFQMAFGEEHSWEDVEEVCNNIIKE